MDLQLFSLENPPKIVIVKNDIIPTQTFLISIKKRIFVSYVFFLSRPRRFGKSLLLSTLEAYFEGKKELFAGLAIEQLEKDWKQYPVLHLDLNTQEYNSVDSLKEKLNIALTEWEKDCGVEPAEKSLATRFEGIIKRTSRKMGQRVVILIDEYDKPMLQAIGRPELQEAYRSLLKSFYGALKSADGYIRFAMLTGGDCT